MASLLRNEYSQVVESFVIVDCRYPYEYRGGHIRVSGGHHWFCLHHDCTGDYGDCSDGGDDDTGDCGGSDGDVKAIGAKCIK